MCDDCWKRAGSPKIDSPGVRAAVAAIAECGGDLPPLLDDYNVEERALDGDEQTCKDWSGAVVIPEHAAKMLAVVQAMRPLSVQERYAALALSDGYWALP